MKFIIDHTKKLAIADVEKFLRDEDAAVELSEACRNEIEKGRSFLEKKIRESNVPVYGINTGFGSLCNVIIPDKDLEQLQENLVKSHACGAGEEVPAAIVKLMLFLKVQSLSYGKSGVKLQTVELLCRFIDHKIYPVIYTQGSLGASGDLAPLAHLSLALIGLGEVNMKGQRMSATDALKRAGLRAIRLSSKEGLALLNGTQFMSAYGVHNLIKAQQFSRAADKIACMSLDAFDCRIDPFKASLHRIRPHPGQVLTAHTIFETMKDSEIMRRGKKQVQDPYSFRCVPQVHGAAKDTIEHVRNVLETEINSVTDNPTLFPEDDEILSGGNFHGQPLALAMDFLCIAISELASISERRIYLLISGQRGLPPFLSASPGLNSGLMIPQYTAAGIVSMNKQLCTPSSADSIVSSNGQEDHVSMGANASVKCFTVIANSQTVLGIELMNAAQALELRRPLVSSAKVEKIFAGFRKQVPFVSTDVILQPLIAASAKFIESDYFN